MGQCRGRKDAQERCDLADVGPMNDVHGSTSVARGRTPGATAGFEAEGSLATSGGESAGAAGSGPE